MLACSWGSSKLTAIFRQALVLSEQKVLPALFIRNASSQGSKSGSPLVVDEVYEEVKKQNFGPILIRDSKNSDGRLKSTFDYGKRADELYGGIPYYQLPIARISARWNNTIITMKKHDGSIICRVSARTAGFLHAKKKTDVAGEATGQAAAKRAAEKGCSNHVRVVVRGIGPGRRPSINGLVQAGMKVVSISDITPLHLDVLPQRPRKIRRL